jgi:hypothetical protein
MEETQKPTEQEIVEQELKEATGADVSIAQAEALNEKLYENLYNNLFKEMSQSNVSKKNVLRGIFNALELGVHMGLAPKMVDEIEAKIGGYFAQLLDKRMLILAKNMREQEEAQRQKDLEEVKQSQEQEKINDN